MILGLTGAFGGGKSTVLEFFRNKGWMIFDADRACHELYDSKNETLIETVTVLFGAQAIAADRSIDRKVIAQEAFAHPEKMKALTAVLYPLLQQEMTGRISEYRKNSVNAVFELPLLYEADYEKLFDTVLAIWTDPELRRERLKKRNFDAGEMARRDARQLPPEVKLEKAGFAVVNNGSPEMLHAQLERLLQVWKKKY